MVLAPTQRGPSHPEKKSESEWNELSAETPSYITAQAVSDALKANNCSRITLNVNSPGGDAFQAVSIYNMLKAAKKPITVIIPEEVYVNMMTKAARVEELTTQVKHAD